MDIKDNKLILSDEEEMDLKDLEELQENRKSSGKLVIDGGEISETSEWGPLDEKQASSEKDKKPSEKETKASSDKADNSDKKEGTEEKSEKTADKKSDNKSDNKKASTEKIIAYDKSGKEVEAKILSLGVDEEGSKYWETDAARSFYFPEYKMTYTIPENWAGEAIAVESPDGILICPKLLNNGQDYDGYGPHLVIDRGFEIYKAGGKEAQNKDELFLYTDKVAIELFIRRDAYSAGQVKYPDAVNQSMRLRKGNTPENNAAFFSFDDPDEEISLEPVTPYTASEDETDKDNPDDNKGAESKDKSADEKSSDKKSTSKTSAGEKSKTKSTKITKDMVKAEIIKLEEGYAKLSQMMYYDSSVVPIKPGSQMEAKWKEEVARHAAGGNTYSFVEARDFSITIEGNGGNVVYTSVIKNRIYSTYFQSTMHQSFEVIDGKILFYSEYETDSIQVYY